MHRESPILSYPRSLEALKFVTLKEYMKERQRGRKTCMQSSPFPYILLGIGVLIYIFQNARLPSACSISKYSHLVGTFFFYLLTTRFF